MSKSRAALMRVKVIYRKNLRMTEGKIAAQVAHAVIGLGVMDPLCTIVVLGVSDTKFRELTEANNCYQHADYGYTEVGEGTVTAAAWLEIGNEPLTNPAGGEP